MDFEDIKIIAIISIIINIALIIAIKYAFDRFSRLMMGGLFGIELTAGSNRPDMTNENFQRYLNYCNEKYRDFKKSD